jgi:hypothetical protein
MAELIIKEGKYFSESDERAFFEWLQSIPGVTSVAGTPEGLVVSLRSGRLSKLALYEFLALYARYGLPMQSLARFKSPQNASWFCARDKYWYAAVFGVSSREA